MNSSSSTKPNRLASEKSPYLLQHAHNPVDWFPWGEEAFRKARTEDKPIFLSIGYSTCHWCHVMERESFENAQTSQVLNDHFVSIKVDREERPDIDQVYMSYVMAATGSGGWPMSVFLTPDKKPFYGGTYFPPEDRYGMPGFRSLLAALSDSWKTRRQEIVESAESALNYLGDTSVPVEATALTEHTLKEAAARFESAFDETYAGFGRAPKFPRSHVLSMILRVWKRTREPKALEIVERTLTAMAEGGMNDQLGGGFHRYSVDGRWRIPHFEKMLYDQAILAETYLEAHQATKNDLYADIAKNILDYLMARMTSAEGGFYSAEDADSLDPETRDQKREGAYYVWKKNEIERHLTSEEAGLFCEYYGIEENGNAIVDPHHEFVRQNTLYRAKPCADPAITAVLERAKNKLRVIRAQRPEPFLDDKILSDWNGLAIASFSSAYLVLQEKKYLQAAQKAAEFVETKLRTPDGRLLHRYRDGEAGIAATLNDHAFLLYGYLRLYEATGIVAWLKKAIALADGMIELFFDKDRGGFFLIAHDAEKLIARTKEVYDGAVPSGNSVAMLALAKLGRMTGSARYEEVARQTLDTFSQAIAADPTNYPQSLIALDYLLGPSQEIVVAANVSDPELPAIHREIFSRFMPNQVVLWHTDSAKDELGSVAAFVKDKLPLSEKATVYLCRNHTCRLPLRGVDGLKSELAKEGH